MEPPNLMPSQDVESPVEFTQATQQQGDRRAALTAFEAAAAAHPARVGLKAEAATELRELGRLDEAEVLLRQAPALEPKHIPSLVGLVRINSVCD